MADPEGDGSHHGKGPPSVMTGRQRDGNGQGNGYMYEEDSLITLVVVNSNSSSLTQIVN